MIVSKQNLRALTKEMFLNLMNEKGLAALEIIRNFNKKERETMTEMIDLLEHVKPSIDCDLCEIVGNDLDDYICIACEGEQVRNKYPNAILNDDCEWELPESEEQ